MVRNNEESRRKSTFFVVVVVVEATGRAMLPLSERRGIRGELI